MRKALIIIFSFLIFTACNEHLKESNVMIKSESDTIEIDNIYKAELYIDHLETILPDFNIIHNNDTFLIPFEEEMNCAIFQAVGRTVGNMSYKGYVDFTNAKGKVGKKDFEILFYVKDTIK